MQTCTSALPTAWATHGTCQKSVRAGPSCTADRLSCTKTLAKLQVQRRQHAHCGAGPTLCVIVDEDNNIIDAQPHSLTVQNRLLGRGIYVLVFNSAGDLLVAKRSPCKDCYPGLLECVVAGVVCQGEEYEDTAAREVHEELGVPLAAVQKGLTRLFIFPYEDATCRVWGCAFSTVYDGTMRLQEEEVAWARFMPLKQVTSLVEAGNMEGESFTPVSRFVFQQYLEQCAPCFDQ